MMLMHRMMKNASPEKKRILFALYGTLLAIGIAIFAAKVM